VKRIVSKAMTDRADELIIRVQSAPNDDALIRRLKTQKQLMFFRVSVISSDRRVLYDTHTKRLLGPKFSQEYVIDHPEVTEAFEHGVGYSENYSDLLGQKFTYLAKAFDFQGQTYVMRLAFPYKYMQELTRDFETGFLSLATLVLFFFSIMTWIIINHLSSPIQQIIHAIRPYQEGKSVHIPEIVLRSASPEDDFGRLAHTLNSLSRRVQRQIANITHERNEKEAILESLIEGVIAVDPQLRITYANSAALTMLDTDRSPVTNQHFLVLRQELCHDLLVRCQTEDAILSHTLQIKRGTERLYLDVLAVPAGKNRGAILVLQDNTTHYKLLEMRKEFIANASHELKTPITIIRGFAEALHDNPGLGLDVQQEITAKIVRNCQRMTNLIRDLLALADIERLPLSRLQSTDLLEVIDQCERTLHSIYPDAQMALHNHVGDPIDLVCDRSLMEQAIGNLVQNAAKYSDGPAQIDITVRLVEDTLKIQIADKGIGIPAADLEHIFERFYTVDKSRTKHVGSSGLGLSIVQTIIEKHLGRIEVESEEGKGTCFTIYLPTTLTAEE
ncbi:MAG: PAS domain-containing protein, partial [Chlamydiia bacterium]|nr:PAS domain-containing protein [Chlamydiia bacterium]